MLFFPLPAVSSSSSPTQVKQITSINIEAGVEVEVTIA